jgi:hypothetical protein
VGRGHGGQTAAVELLGLRALVVHAATVRVLVRVLVVPAVVAGQFRHQRRVVVVVVLERRVGGVESLGFLGVGIRVSGRLRRPPLDGVRLVRLQNPILRHLPYGFLDLLGVRRDVGLVVPLVPGLS